MRLPPRERTSTVLPRWAMAMSLGILAVVSEGRGSLGAPAPAPPVPGGLSPVVARVGEVTITVADVERRLATVPPFQLRTFGGTPAEVRRNFVEKVLVREALLAQGAAGQGFAARDDVKERMRGVLRTAFMSRLKTDVVARTVVTDADIKAYYEKNSAKFNAPERVSLWIIATHKPDEAKEILDDLHKDGSPKHWAEIASKKSVDAATGMRKGDLGWVLPDGTTAEPGLKVSAAIMDAVSKLKDGEIAAEPIKDGDRWVVAWRRQTMKSVNRPVELEAGSIRQMLVHMRTDAKVKEAVAALRKENLHDHDADMVDLFDITPQGEITPMRRPGALPAGRRGAASPVPAPGSNR
jgi:peptidyl-prolyl cis-trans isomerase C